MPQSWQPHMWPTVRGAHLWALHFTIPGHFFSYCQALTGVLLYLFFRCVRALLFFHSVPFDLYLRAVSFVRGFVSVMYSSHPCFCMLQQCGLVFQYVFVPIAFLS